MIPFYKLNKNSFMLSISTKVFRGWVWWIMPVFPVTEGGKE
jgi:hypothetical protein